MMAIPKDGNPQIRPLPEGWGWTTLGKTGQLLRGVSYRKEDASEQPKNDFVPILRATNIQDEKLILTSDLVYVPARYVKTEQYLKPGDIVVCMSSGSKHLVGKTAQLFQEWTGSFGTFCAAIRPHSAANPKYLGYFFSSPRYRQFIREKSVGININNLKPSDFETLEIPLPPLPEQERIVARLEELLSDLEAGVKALERVRAGAKRYKASVLKVACEGKLSGNQGSGNKELGDGELPEGWRWITVSDVAESMKNGIYKPAEYYADDGIACLRMYNIEDGSIVWKDIKRMKLTDEEVETYRLLPGDILVNRVNSRELVGKAAVIPSGLESLVYESKNIRLKIKHHVADSTYINYCFLAYRQKYFNFNAQQVVGMASINQTQIAQMPIPLPPLEEQQRIVAEVERRLESVKAVESMVAAGLKRAGRLRQSILKNAFEGKLAQ